MADIEKLTETFFLAAMKRAREIDPAIAEPHWDDDTPEAHTGREAFRAGVAAVVEAMAVTDAVG